MSRGWVQKGCRPVATISMIYSNGRAMWAASCFLPLAPLWCRSGRRYGRTVPDLRHLPHADLPRPRHSVTSERWWNWAVQMRQVGLQPQVCLKALKPSPILGRRGVESVRDNVRESGGAGQQQKESRRGEGEGKGNWDPSSASTTTQFEADSWLRRAWGKPGCATCPHRLPHAPHLPHVQWCGLALATSLPQRQLVVGSEPAPLCLISQTGLRQNCGRSEPAPLLFKP